MLKLIGVDTSFKAPSILEQPVINASDFRGEAFGVLARANQAALEAQKNRIINQASTDLTLSQQRQTNTGGGVSSAGSGGFGGGTASGRGGSSKEFDPSLDVSEREKWEYEKQKDAAEMQLDVAKFQTTSGLDERKFQRNIYEDERDFGRDVYEDERDFITGREDEMFDRTMDEANFNYRAQKDFTERQDKLYEKAKSEFQAQQYALAQQDVQELMLASEGLMRKGGGLEAIRGELTNIFRRYPGIAPEKQAEIIQGIYSTPQRVNREQIEKTERKIDEVQQFQRNTVLQAKRLELQSLTSGLKTATGSQRQQLLGRLTTKLGEFSSSNADPLTKAMVLSNLYEEIANKGEAGADVQQKLLDYANYSRDASRLYLMRNQMSPSQYSLQESLLQQKYGVTGFRLDDTNFDQKTALDTLRTSTDLRELRTKNALDAQFGLNADRAMIAQLAKANADPARAAALEAMAARYGNPPALVQAVKLAKDMHGHREKTVEVQQKISTLEKEAAMLQASDAQTVLNMLEGGEATNTQQMITTAMLMNANPKLAAALQQGKPIPPEVKAEIQQTWKQQRARIISEINVQKRLVETQYQMERDYLNSYFNKDNFAALDAVRQQMPQLRAGMQYGQVGVSRSPQLQFNANAGGSTNPDSTWAEQQLQRLQQPGGGAAASGNFFMPDSLMRMMR